MHEREERDDETEMREREREVVDAGTTNAKVRRFGGEERERERGS